MAVSSLAAWYKRHERHYSSVALIGGFILDILTLRRADRVWENSWIVGYLLAVAAVIVYLSRREKSDSVESSRTHFWLMSLMQFSFGGLLSAFFILYFRSATLSVSWPFLLILALAFAANERLKGYHDRLVFQVSFLYLSLLTFAIFFLPVIFGAIGHVMFLASGLASLVVVRIFLRILFRASRGKADEYKKSLYLSVAGIYLAVNVLYFANIIPPIPLSLKEGGIYYSVSRAANGDYILSQPEKSLWDHLSPYPKVELSSAEQQLFAFTAIFSPAKFTTNISHQWQRYDEGSGEWVTVARVGLGTSGGRLEGYRTYSVNAVTPGKWRVNVLTSSGQVLGRIGFVAVAPR